MFKIRDLRWIILILLLIFSLGMARQALSNMTYLPLVMSERTMTPSHTPTATSTPTQTGTPTPSRTPTSIHSLTPTATPYKVFIVEVHNPAWGDPLEEYVRIRNDGSGSANMTGWYLRDDGDNRYDFPNGFYLAKDQSVRVWTKAGDDTIYDLYWGSEVEVWNDSRDCAYLRDDSNGQKVLVDLFCYTPRFINSLMIKGETIFKDTSLKE